MDAGNLHPLSFLRTGLDRALIMLPSGATGIAAYYAAQKANLSTGIPHTFTLLRTKAPWPMSVQFTLNDAGGADLVVQATINGWDVFGRKQREIVTGMGDGITQSTLAWGEIESIVLDTATAGAAGDSADVGIGNSNTGAERANLAIPFQVPATGTPIVQLYIPTSNVAEAPAGVNLTNGTFQVNQDIAAQDVVLAMFDHDIVR